MVFGSLSTNIFLTFSLACFFVRFILYLLLAEDVASQHEQQPDLWSFTFFLSHTLCLTNFLSLSLENTFKFVNFRFCFFFMPADKTMKG